MLYYLLYPLYDRFVGFNVIRYITFRTLMAAFTAMFIYFVFGKPFIRFLAKKQFWQTVRTTVQLPIWTRGERLRWEAY